MNSENNKPSTNREQENLVNPVRNNTKKRKIFFSLHCSYYLLLW